MLGPERCRFRAPEARFEHQSHVEVVPVGPEVSLVRLGKKPVGFLLGEDPRELVGACHGSTDLAGNELKVGSGASTGRKPANWPIVTESPISVTHARLLTAVPSAGGIA